MTNFEGIFIIPCGNHAFGKKIESFEHRYNMCQLAFFNQKQPINEVEGIGLVQNNIVISDIENTDKTSYAIDLAILLKSKLEEFKEGEIELYWIVGSDCTKDLERWKDIEDLKNIVSFYEIPRPDSGAIFDLRATLPSVSSTSVRDRLKRGKGVENIVPFNVAHYIKYHNLYLE